MTAYFPNIEDLKAIRQSYNLSLAEVGSFLNVAPNTVKNYENGRTQIPLTVFLRLCSIYQIEPSNFIVTATADI